MIKQKMFKLHRHKSSSSDHKSDDERIDFKFSNIEAFQVPKGWDKLSLSLISAKTGKTISKSGKALVRNGNCRWTETLSESIWISRDDASKDLEQCLFKLLVTMGSARSSVLGEATINLAGHMSSKASVHVSLPLQKCNHGTIVQVEVQCLAPRTKLRNEAMNSFTDVKTDNDDIDNRSDVSNHTFSKSFGSSSSNLTHPGEHGSRETSFSALGSHPSFDSEDSLGRESFSPQSNLSGVVNNVIGRQDSTGSQNSTSYGSYHVFESPTSNLSPYNSGISGSGKNFYSQKEDLGRLSHSIATSPLRNADSSQTFLNTEELKAEARMWERNARKLMLDLDSLRKEFNDQGKHLANLDMELSASQTECDGLKQEIEHLKEESMEKNEDIENMRLQALDKDNIQKELEDEIRFQRESYGNLALQLKKTQESNLELVSVLQEMEETTEKQKMEIENLLTLNSKYDGTGVKCNGHEDDEGENIIDQVSKGKMRKAYCDSDLKGSKRAHLISDIDEPIEQENKSSVELQLQELQKSQKNSECPSVHLEAELSKVQIGQESKITDFETRGNLDLIKEIEYLKEKVHELERDCSELTDENLELLLKMKDFGKDVSSSGASLKFSSHGSQADDFPSAFGSVESKLESQIWKLKEEMKKKEILLQGVGDDHLQIRCNDLESKCNHLELQLQAFKDKACYLDGELQRYHAIAEKKENVLWSSSQGLENLNKELESRVEDLGKELLAKTSEIEELKADCLLKEEEMEALRYQQRDLKTQISDLQKLNSQMEGSMEGMQREGSITFERLNMLRNDMVMLRSITETHISANKLLERKSLELESCIHELELNMSKLEEENVQLSELISGLEAQLRYMTDARESSLLETQHSETHLMNLQDEISRLVNETEAQKVDMRNKLQDMERRWLEAQEESELLKKANPTLQATAESLIKECSSLQKSNGELRQQRLELQKHCSVLEAELRESQHRFSWCSKKIEALEAKFSSILTDVALKEKTLALELDTIHVLDNEHKEKLDLGESLLNQMYLEKAAEVENLQQEVAHLSSQISVSHDERERRVSEAVFEMHNLRADNVKLEAALQEISGKLELSEKKLDTVQMECGSKVLHLMGELALSRQNHEVLVANHVKLQELLQNVRCNEEKLEGTVDELELELKKTDFEKQQLAEETSSLKIQLQKISLLQDEVLSLTSSLNEMKFENQRLEASLQLVSGDYKELKAERILLVEKISDMKKTVSELEDCRRSNVALEEKILLLEGDLTAREALCAQDAELKNELEQIKRTNSQLQWRIKCLEEEKEECIEKVQDLEEELKQKNGINSLNNHLSRLNDTNTAHEELMPSEVEENKTNHLSKDQSMPSVTDKLQQFSKGEDSEGVAHHIEVNNKQSSHNGYSTYTEMDVISRIQFLENELSEALEANDMYKAQLKSMLSEGSLSHSNEHKVHLLEAELIEIRERYLHMSLKYAEVEAQREQLVMKLKATTDRRTWF